MKRSSRSLLVLAAVLAPLWIAVCADQFWFRFLEQRVVGGEWIQVVVYTLSAAVAIGGLWFVRREPNLTKWAVFTAGYLPLWQGLVFGSDALGADLLRVTFAQLGVWGLFLLGMGWVIWWLERWAAHYRVQRVEKPETLPKRTSNPLNPDAWYYGRKAKTLNQSLAAMMSYSLAFMIALMLFSQIQGCQDLYEMPAGGGKAETMRPQTVKIQKVIRKKFVINPFSLIKFNPPPLDEVKLNLEEATAHLYKIGQGEGDGSGFSGGTRRGKVRFIRLEYQGGDWDQDFGIGADLNMLIQYNVLTSQPVAEQTESRSIAQLRSFPPGRSPPFVYLTGQRNVTLSQSEAKILREYLLDKHGMLFVDNGGSYHFHNQVFAALGQVLPNVQPVKVPLDDVIHRVPFAMPFLPYVAPHGGKDAWGWKVDGRWVVYYHPGDIGDAWSDGHSSVPSEVWQACYQLGTNVMFYAHAEYNKWLQAQKK